MINDFAIEKIIWTILFIICAGSLMLLLLASGSPWRDLGGALLSAGVGSWITIWVIYDWTRMRDREMRIRAIGAVYNATSALYRQYFGLWDRAQATVNQPTNNRLLACEPTSWDAFSTTVNIDTTHVPGIYGNPLWKAYLHNSCVSLANEARDILRMYGNHLDPDIVAVMQKLLYTVPFLKWPDLILMNRPILGNAFWEAIGTETWGELRQALSTLYQEVRELPGVSDIP